MKTYLKHLFSWKGEAGRLEILGIFFLCTFGNVAIWAVIAYLIATISTLFFGRTLSVDSIVLSHLGYFSIPAQFCMLMATARRCRHIGISPYWSLLLLIVFVAPIQYIFITLVTLFLVCCPPIKNKSPQPHAPSYLFLNVALTFAAIFLWFVCVLGASFYNKNHVSLSVVPYTGPKTVEELIPSGTNPSFIHPYTGQTIPAVSIGHQVYDDPKHHVWHDEWTFPLPDLISEADRIEWNTKTLVSCGEQCKQMRSMDSNHFLRIEFINDSKPHWAQRLADKTSIIENIYFEDSSRRPYRMMRLKNEQLVQDFSKSAEYDHFMDSSFADHPLFTPPFKSREEVGDIYLWIKPDGSFIPGRVLTNPTPDTKLIYYHPEHFTDPWPGFHPSTQFLDFMFPAK